jgi:hypothetical protein
MNKNFDFIQFLELLRSHHCRTELKTVSIKFEILRAYLGDEECSDSLLREVRAEILAINEGRPLFSDPMSILDDDGDLAIMLPEVEGRLISGVMRGRFACALALIIIIESCYDPTVGSASRLNRALERFHPLINGEGLPPAALLHDFLEVDECFESWFSKQVTAHQLVSNEDYFVVPAESPLPDTHCMGHFAWETLLTPGTATKLACSTPTLRGRKLTAFHIDPGVSHFDHTELPPVPLELLFAPPVRGVASL